MATPGDIFKLATVASFALAVTGGALAWKLLRKAVGR